MNGIYLHGFGARYDLPISLVLYLYSAAGVVVISFVLVAALAGERTGERATRYPTLRSGLLTRLDASPWPRRLGGAIGVIALATVIVTGIWGTQNPLINPAEYLVWIYMWAAMVILTGLLGNIWAYVNPFAALYSVIRPMVPAPARELPKALRIWPAAALYFAFATFELASGLANRPALLGAAALVYTLFTLAGMVLFGAEAWLGRVEFLTVLFDLVARFAPIERDAHGEVRLRPWGVGLLRPYPEGWDRIAFIVLTLASLAFDGITATQGYQSLTTGLRPIWSQAGAFGAPLFKGVSFLVLALLFLVVFNVFMAVVIYFGSVKVKLVPTMTAFALTLIPIALVYNAAHNYSYMVIQGQGLPMALQYAFSQGPPPTFVASFALANAALVWYLQVILIVIGHVIAVFLAHMRAGERFRTARNALLSQYPMLILMVAYTTVSLTILAQPVTRGG